MRGVTRLPSVGDAAPIDFNQRTPCGVQALLSVIKCWQPCFNLTRPMRGATLFAPFHKRQTYVCFNLTHPMRGATSYPITRRLHRRSFNLTHPMRGATAKLIQFKRILVACRMYSFANYVLHILKHSPTYCIGITLYLVLFGAKLPVILCQLVVRTTLMTLL